MVVALLVKKTAGPNRLRQALAQETCDRAKVVFIAIMIGTAAVWHFNVEATTVGADFIATLISVFAIARSLAHLASVRGFELKPNDGPVRKVHFAVSIEIGWNPIQGRWRR
jgi:hypothetical protein